MLSLFWYGCLILPDNSGKTSSNTELESVISSVQLYSVLPETYSEEYVDPSKYYACLPLESTVELVDGYEPALAYEWVNTSSGEEVIIGNTPSLTPEELINGQELFLRVIPTIDGVAYPSMNSNPIEFTPLGIHLVGLTSNPTQANSVIDGIHAELDISSGLGIYEPFGNNIVYNDCDSQTYEFRIIWRSDTVPSFEEVTTSDTLDLYPCDNCSDDEVSKLSAGDEWDIYVEAKLDDGEFEYNNSISGYYPHPDYEQTPFILNNSPVEANNIAFRQDNLSVDVVDTTKNLTCDCSFLDYDGDSIDNTHYKFEYMDSTNGQWIEIQNLIEQTLLVQNMEGIPNMESMRCVVTTYDDAGEYIYPGPSFPIQ